MIDWLKEVKQNAGPDVLVYLIGNKADLEEMREVTPEKAKEFADEHNIRRIFESSAKSGLNVEEVFSLAAKELFLTSKNDEDTGSEASPGKPAAKGLKDLEKGKKKQGGKNAGCCP